MKNFVTSSMTDWTSFFRESIIFPPSYSDHKETLKYAQSTSICNAQSTSLQLNTEALKWEQEYSADRKALFSVIADSAAHTLLCDACMEKSRRESWDKYSASSGTENLCSTL